MYYEFLDFPKAMTLLLDGSNKRLCRASWHNIRHIQLVYVSLLSSSDVFKNIVVCTRDSIYNTYTPTQSDMLATDWYEVP